ncbi:MAG: hypothetical protein V4647_06140 [Pseudomonadota bacterium]
MRLAVIAVLSCVVLAAPARAQDQPAAPRADRIVFDIEPNGTDLDEWDFGIARANQQPASPPPTCSSDNDIIQAQATGPQRYDDNGAPIRTPASCSLDRPRATVGETVSANGAQTASRTEFLRQPQCEESATGYACASSGSLGSARYGREAQCQETATSRTCSSSFSVGNSEEGRSLATEMLERMARD